MTDSKSKKKENKFFGLPMRWDRKNIFKNLWNPNDDRIFPPKNFGIGWDVNFHALLREVGVIRKPKKKSKVSKK